MLRPSLAHGYSDRVLQRLGPLQTDADNVTSLAFRSMQAQTFSSPSSGATNAIAVPLITSTGCIGVLAAEVTQPLGGNDRLAVARIFAAQLATIVTPVTGAAIEQTAQALTASGYRAIGLSDYRTIGLSRRASALPRTSHLAPRTSHPAPRTPHPAPRTPHLVLPIRRVLSGTPSPANGS
jgi:hypothetical protein